MKSLVFLAVVVVSAVAAGSSPAAPAQRIVLPDVSIQAFDPCTGAPSTLTLSNRVLVIHDDVGPNLDEHVASTVTGDVSSSDGFSGRFLDRSGMYLVDVSDQLVEGVFAQASSATLTDGSSRVIVLHAVFHVTVLGGSGELQGFVDSFTLECRGTPS